MAARAVLSCRMPMGCCAVLLCYILECVPTAYMSLLALLLQDWVRLCPKFARHIFITDRMSRPSAGPDHTPAAWSMGNSFDQWLKTYYPTYKLEKMKQSQVQMEHYRQQALQQQGTADADPRVLLAGEAPAPAHVAAPAAAPATAPEVAGLAQQLQQMQQQQAEFQAGVMQRLEEMQPMPNLAAAAPAAAPPPPPVVKPEPQWPVQADDFDLVVVLSSSSSSDYDTGYESMSS